MRVKIMEKKKTLYFGAGWFNEKQNKACKILPLT